MTNRSELVGQEVMLVIVGQSDVHTTYTAEFYFALALVCSLEPNDHLQLECTFHLIFS